MPALLRLLRAVAFVGVAAIPAIAGISHSHLKDELVKLNKTVGGRLYRAVSFELPCFAEYNGKAVERDDDLCEAIQENYTDPIFRVNYFGAYMMPQWETCQVANNSGCLLDYSDPSDPLAYEDVDCELGNVPPYYIDVQSAKDVQAALTFSRSTGVRLSVKNKGHDYKGRSSGKGTLALWVTNLNSISYNPSFVPEGCAASTTYDALTIGPGALAQSVLQYADSINRTFIAGYHQTVGTGGGYTLGGGHSVLSPVYGLAVDRVRQMKVVTPSGQFLVANECQNSDLFWALRGGGGSAFGVVIENTHELAPRVTLQVAYISFTSSNVTVLAEWYDLLVNNTYQWGLEGWGGHIEGPKMIYVNPLLSNAEANSSMAEVAEFAVALGGEAIVEELDSYLAFFTKYVTAAEAAVATEITLGTRLLTTDLFDSEEGRATLSQVITDVLPFASPYVVISTPFLYNYTANTTSVTPAWRDSLWHLSVHSTWAWNSTTNDTATQYLEVSEHTQKFRDITPGSGAYFNEGDVYEPNHTYSYWGDNYPRLLEIKKKYDPEGLLDCWQCVGWKGPEDPLYQCYIPLPQ